MNAGHTATILRELDRQLGDAKLLARFAATRDGDAFAELVRRHGPLVLSVCRRVTGHPQDAEDAFQATFLVLAKKAGAVRNPDLLANYLYGVAFRVASRARRSALRRRRREVTVAALPDPPAAAQPPAAELLPIVDQELTALAECYRDAIVLCDLRGQSREDAAVALGIPEGTLSSRLANGRKKLAARLARRGVSLSAALPLLLAEASAAVPTDLVTKTCGLVAHWASGGSVPVALAKLASGGLNVRAILVLGAVFAAGAVGAVFAATPRDEQPPADPPKPPVQVARAEPAPQPKDEPKKDKPVVGFTGNPRMLSSFDLASKRIYDVRWNATGTHLAFSGSQDAPNEPPSVRMVVWLVSPDPKTKTQYFYPKLGSTLVAVADDGHMALTDLREYHLVSGHHKLIPWAGEFDPAQKKVGAQWVELLNIKLELPETHGYAFPGEMMKTFRTVAYVRDAGGAVKQIEVLEADTQSGGVRKSLLKIDHGPHALSANGKRLAVMETDDRYAIYDVDRGTKLRSGALTDVGQGIAVPGEAPHMVLSPDGRRLVVRRGIGRTRVVDTDAGSELPALDGTDLADVRSDGTAFTGDGRLLVAAGTRYKVVTTKNGGREQKSYSVDGLFLCVWDTQTGKVVKVWNRGNREAAVRVAFNPARPVLAILEQNGDHQTRVGFWDFAAEVKK